MKHSKHIIFRKLIASGFLALLVFVYAEKFSHTHHKNTSASEQKGYSPASITATCAICDFTLAKDAAIPEFAYVAVPFNFIQQQFIDATPSYYYIPGKYISNKGPPAC